MQKNVSDPSVFKEFKLSLEKKIAILTLAMMFPDMIVNSIGYGQETTTCK